MREGSSVEIERHGCFSGLLPGFLQNLFLQEDMYWLLAQWHNQVL